LANYTITNAGADFTIAQAGTTTAVATLATEYGDTLALSAQLTSATSALVNQGTVVFKIKSGATVLYTTAAVTVDATGLANVNVTNLDLDLNVGSYTITASYSGGLNFLPSGSNIATLVVSPREGTAAYIGQTVFVTSGSSSTTAQVTLTASIIAEAGSIAHATATFKDLLTGKILATNVPVSSVPGASRSTGTANTIVTLSTGQYGACQYLIEVTLGGSYTNYQQLPPNAAAGTAPYNAAHPVVTIMQPATANSIIGAGAISYLPESAGLFKSDEVADVNFTVRLKYNKSGVNAQGQIQIVIPRSDGMYYIKSNSITSVAVETTIIGGIRVPTGYATVYTKASIYKILSNGTQVSVDGNVSLRMDIFDASRTLSEADVDQVGFTVLSSKTSQLYYSNNWIWDDTTRSWKTVVQNLLNSEQLSVL
jgi:hypothetical protein